VTVILEEHERAERESMMSTSQIINPVKDKQDPVLTGRTFTEYFVIFGSATLPWLAACTRRTIIIVKQLWIAMSIEHADSTNFPSDTWNMQGLYLLFEAQKDRLK